VKTEHIKEYLLHAFNEKAPIARHFGMRLSFDDEGNAVIDLSYNPNLDHAFEGIHGGVYAAMLDTAGWFTAVAARDEACWVATSEMSIHFLELAQRTSLRAVGRVVKSGKRQDVVEMRLYDEQECLVGHAMGTFVVLPNIPLEVTYD
jgi:uncharacterized protein (TIGR00369 family)